MRQQYARRTQALTIMLGLIALAIVVQITRIQNSVEAAAFREQASNYAYELRTFYPDRGEIYDRNGHLLAGNMSVFEIGVDLNNMRDPSAIAASVSAELNLDYSKILNDIQNPAEGIVYVVIADFIEPEHVVNLQTLKDALTI